MSTHKSPPFSIRLPMDIHNVLTELAKTTRRDKTSIITEALAIYLSASHEPQMASPDGLSRVITLLEGISEAVTQPRHAVTPRPAPAVTPRNTQAPKAQPQRRAVDPRFVHVDPEADALIVRMTGEMAGLADISNALNALGYVSATGQEWTKSRVRDYRHKLRERGLFNGE